MRTVIPVFIASPSDVPEERDLVDQAVQGLSKRLRPALEVGLETQRWEEFAPRTSAHGRYRFQDQINSRLEKAGVFVGILFRRYGTEVDARRNYSGTDAEFRHAIKNRARTAILTYFRDPGRVTSPKGKAELARLDELKASLVSKGIAYQPYADPAAFRERITLDLLETVLSIVGDVARRDRLRDFFSLGISEVRSSASVLIAYPTIHKHQRADEAPRLAQQSSKTTYDWQSRLLPNVVYEDFKAIQKIEGALRFIGVRDYSSVTLDHPDLTREIGNRVWLCLPRNRLGRAHLDRLGDRARFSIVDLTGEGVAIKWTTPKGDSFLVRSPLGQYLELQRKPGRRRWSPEMGHILARDFAVLGRFEWPEGDTGEGGEPYYHYFMAGIRGLGTWGVGWLIDHRARALRRILRAPGNSRRNVQALLEVTYRNYRIRSVEDVSAKPEEYFRTRVSPSFVEEEVRAFQLSQ